MNIEEKLTASIISAINMLYGQEVPAKKDTSHWLFSLS